MRFPRVIIVIVVYGYPSNAAPRILFPLNSQVPPVARASVPFSFTFAPSTFSTDLPNAYSLSNAPGWLSLDSGARTLSGTPTPDDADLNISITASDETGSVTMNSELVVRTAPAPAVQIPLESQSMSLGAEFSTPSTVIYYPSSHFDITFNPETFVKSGSDSTLNYYAVSQDNTPLPSWVSFDAETLSFSGETPDSYSLVQPPQTFGIQLIASDVEGFAGTSIAFNIAVGNHILAFDNAIVGVRGEGDELFQYKSLSGDLKLDGQVISPSNLSSINAQMPNWLAFDASTFVLSGTAPADATSCSVTVTAADLYGDSASVVINIDFSTALFIQNITELNATIGEYFSYDIVSSLVDPSDVMITAQFEPNTPWLSFNPSNITLFGKVPTGISPSTVRIILQASSKTSTITQSMSIILNVSGIMAPSSSMMSLMTSVLKASSTSSATSTMNHDSAAPTSSEIHMPSDGKEGSNRKLSKGEITAIAIPLVLLILAVTSCLFWICCFRRKRGNGAKSPAKSDISGPVPVISSSRIPEIGASKHSLSRPKPHRNHTMPTNGAISDENSQRSKPNIRKSQTMSDLSGTRTSHLAESNSSGNRGRSVSESQSSDWKTASTQVSSRTQDSAYPPFGSRSNSNGATRNFSRKRVGEQIRREDTSINSSIQQTPEHNYDPVIYEPRTHSFLENSDNLIREEGQDEFECEPSGGFGRDALSRSTSSWTDLSAGGDRGQGRESFFSAETQDTGVLFDSISINKNDNGRSIRIVPTSPQAPPKAHLSTIEASPRTIYKPSRSNGGGGFFLGGPRCGSRSSSRTHKSPSIGSGFASSLHAYSSTNSPALPAPIPQKWNETSSILTRAINPRLLTTQQSSIEKMVSAAGLRSDSDTPDQRIGLGIGHGKLIGDSNNRVRHSFLSNISGRISRSFQSRNSKQSFNGNETDTESQFQAADEDGTPQRSPHRYDQRISPLKHTDIHSNNESNDSDDYEEESPENSIVEEYVRNSLTNSYATIQGYNNVRTSFTTRWSNNIPIEYSQDEESPTLGQGTLGKIQRVVVSGKNSRHGSLVVDEKGERVPNSPMMVALRERVVAMRDRIGPSSREGIGLGLGLRDNEAARIVGGRGKRPVSVELDGKGSSGYGDGLGIYRRSSNTARHYEFGEDVDDENDGMGGNAFDSSSAFL